MSRYWGELSSFDDNNMGIDSEDRDEIIKRRLIVAKEVNTDCELNKDYLNNDYAKVFVSDIQVGNPVMVHSIKLMQFIRLLDTNSDSSLNRHSLPQLVSPKQTNHCLVKPKHLNFNLIAIKQLMRKAVILMIYHYGFEMCSESVIDLLNDIACEYLCRMCHTLRTVSDSFQLRSANDFVDALDRVFHDMNVCNFESLRQYDTDLRLYNQNLMKEALRKIGINESINCTANTQTEFPLKLCDKSPTQETNTSEDLN